ncbi:hypothetical protein H5410_031458 [Solanum commersonii]|uniref:Uncharacterized protein n=1 Tax=Solanum commersonii TaxID=4109 RepID=A0A9J5YK82_SOLCO|nr:hypothetical protein H5410_031458 [Solanum commersonii]
MADEKDESNDKSLAECSCSEHRHGLGESAVFIGDMKGYLVISAKETSDYNRVAEHVIKEKEEGQNVSRLRPNEF